LGHQAALKVFQEFVVVANGAGRLAQLQGVGSQRAGGLADIPFRWVQPIASVRDVSCTEVLRCRYQVLHALRQ
jgi:hypothetical protein